MTRMRIRRTQLLAAMIAATLTLPAGASPVRPEPRKTRHPTPAVRHAARVALTHALDHLLATTDLAHARVGICVRSLTEHKEIYDHDAGVLLNPASNVKLFTSAAALELLGPAYRFDTELYVNRLPDHHGVIHGDLYVEGKGDPTFTTERMYRLVEELWQLGVRRITGRIVLDDTFFDGKRLGPGWEQDDSDHAYIAPTGALSFNYNSVEIHVRPGPRVWHRAVVTVEPDSRYFIIKNHVVTGSHRSRRRHYISSVDDGRHQEIEVHGVEPINRDGKVYYRRIGNPPIYFGDTFIAFLRRRGIHVGYTEPRLGTVPDGAQLLYRSESERLADIVETMDKVSNNHMAEQLLKTMGAEVMGPPGSWPKGVAAVERWLAERVGIPRGSYVMKNGSGLNDTNRFSARQITKVLAHMWNHFQVMPEYVTALPVAGRDGTARFRLDGTPAAGILRAKTGTLENVSAFSGYVATADGEVLAFSILVNDYPGHYSQVIDSIDSVAEAIAEYARPKSSAPSTAVAVAPKPLTPAEVAAKVGTYLALGQAADPHNVRFLRTALRTETDPLIRAVVAEAIYRSDADLGQRLLLDDYHPTRKLVRRLHAVAKKDDTSPTPVITSVADIAAEGNARALDALLETAHLASGMKGLDAELAETLVEVARTAPKEMLEALTSADPAVSDDALALFVQGLRAEKEAPGHHPFVRALRTAARAKAPDDDGAADPTQAVTAARIQSLATTFKSLLKKPAVVAAKSPAPPASPAPAKADPKASAAPSAAPSAAAARSGRPDTPPPSGAGGG